MRVRIALIFFLSASTLEASGGEFGQLGPYTPPNYQPGSCIIDPHDPFDPNAQLPAGPNKGNCIDTRERRSAVWVSDQGLRSRHFEAPDFRDLIVANVFHEGQYWVARIPVQSIQNAILQVEYFPLTPLGMAKIAHTQVLVNFDRQKPVELTAQSRMSSRSHAAVNLDSLVFSIEVVGERGPGFNAVKGMQDYFVLAYRIVSLEEKIDWMIRRQRHRVKQWELSLSSNEIVNFIIQFMDVSTKLGMTDRYHTLTANCSNVLGVLLDQSLGQSTSTCARIVDSVSNLLPFSLSARGLIRRRLPSLNAQMAGHP